ncbi:MAG: hypothetical protein JO192_13780 [Candidatus Eremiobacteraeota bacterium]|nr:hypothetical protein [Candidatus Eremiobacteraeota bacterium]
MLIPPLRPQPFGRSGSAPPRGATRADPPPAAPATAPVAGSWLVDAQPTPEETALLEREQAFDLNLRLRAEAERESNALRELYQEQMKRDDEYLRRCIELI